MSKIEFFEEFKMLCAYYKDEIYKNKRITALYYEKVKNMPIKEFKKMCNELINIYKFMPRVAEFETQRNYNHKQRYYTEEFLNQFYS